MIFIISKYFYLAMYLFNQRSEIIFIKFVEIPFPTGEVLEINPNKTFDYSRFISAVETEGMPAPFVVIRGNDKLRLKLTNPYNIRNFAKFIEYCNLIGCIPAA